MFIQDLKTHLHQYPCYSKSFIHQRKEFDESLKKRIDQEEEILIVDEVCPSSGK